MDGPTYTRQNEGCHLTAYRDQGGVWTIGYGCTGPDIGPSTVWTQTQADNEFVSRYALAGIRAKDDLGAEAWAALDPIRQAALTDMAYQLGGAGLGGFDEMLLAVHFAHWQAAHDECLDSRYARQTPNRAQRNAHILLTGCWPA